MDLKEWRRLALQSLVLFFVVFAAGGLFSGKKKGNAGGRIQAAVQKEETVKTKTVQKTGEGSGTADRTVQKEKEQKKQKKNAKKTYNHMIVLDAGHGGIDEGTLSVDWKYSEKSYALAFARRLKILLEEKNVKVYLTRSEDVYMTKKARVDMANKLKPELFISIHCNAAEEWERSAGGLETLYSAKKPKYGSLSNKKLAGILLDELAQTTGREKRGTIPREKLYLLRHSEVPTVIAEVAYMTNASDMQFLKSEKGQELIVRGLYQGILKALKAK